MKGKWVKGDTCQGAKIIVARVLDKYTLSSNHGGGAVYLCSEHLTNKIVHIPCNRVVDVGKPSRLIKT